MISAIDLKSTVRTTGNQYYTGKTRLGGNLTTVSPGAGTVKFDASSPVTLNATAIAIDSSATNGAVSFGATVDAAATVPSSLAVTAGTGTISFAADVGATHPLVSATLASSNGSNASIAVDASFLTTKNQDYKGLVTIAGTTGATPTVMSSAGQLIFEATVNQTGGTIKSGNGQSSPAFSYSIVFDTDYKASGTASLEGVKGDVPLDFKGNVVLAAFLHNGQEIVFDGTATQTFDSNAQIIGDVLVNGAVPQAGLQPTTFVQQGPDPSMASVGYMIKVENGILDLHTNKVGWVAVGTTSLTAAETAELVAGADIFHGVAGTLELDTGTKLLCGALTSSSTYVIDNVGANIITASGSVSIAGNNSANFLSLGNSTLVMNGSAVTLSAAPELGNLTVAGTVALGANLSLIGDFLITSAGTLDASTSSRSISFSGDWTNQNPDTHNKPYTDTGDTIVVNGFHAGNSTVIVTKSSGTVSFIGATTFFNFTCNEPGLTLEFQNFALSTTTPPVFSFMKSLDVEGTTNSLVTMTRITDTGTPSYPYSYDADANKFWQIDMLSGSNLDNMTNVYVKYSDAQRHPIIADNSVKVSFGAPYYDNKWLPGLPLLYSYTEDSDGNGKIDRIRVQANADLNGVFTTFTATVSNAATGEAYNVKKYEMGPTANMFYIDLEEKPYDDTGVILSWDASDNTSLKDALTNTKIASLYTHPMKTIDTAAPRIDYTLALPGGNQDFVHASENLYDAASGGPRVFKGSGSPGDFIPSSYSTITSGNGNTSQEYLVAGSTLSAQTIASGSSRVTLSGAVDGGVAAVDLFDSNPVLAHPYYPTALGSYPGYDVAAFLGGAGLVPPYPLTAAAGSHRVSDVLINVPIASSTDATYFVWPIYAKDSVVPGLSDTAIANLTPSQTASQGIGLIRAFDGSQWLRDQDITVQARVQPSLASTLWASSGLRLWFDSNLPSALVGSSSTLGPIGLWLPSFAETGFSGLVPFPDAAAYGGKGASESAAATVAGTSLYDFTIPSADSRIFSGASVGFFFTFDQPAAEQPLYAARLDMKAGDALPSNWYRLVKPFAFSVHDVNLQKGGATILNNVIDPTRGDTVRLSYQLTQDGSVTVTVFTLDGDVVARLVNTSQTTGDYAVSWNGRNLAGNPVARGLYFIRIVAPGMDEIRKVLVVRN